MVGQDEQKSRQHKLDVLIGERLRYAMADRPVEVVAAQVGVSVATMAAYLSGQRHIPSERLLSLAKLLQVPLSDFFCEPSDDQTQAD